MLCPSGYVDPTKGSWGSEPVRNVLLSVWAHGGREQQNVVKILLKTIVSRKITQSGPNSKALTSVTVGILWNNRTPTPCGPTMMLKNLPTEV
jgi:hypothetical protein